MDNIIDNLATLDITSFTKIELKMLDIAKKHKLSTIDVNGYFTATNRNKNGKGNGSRPFNKD